MNKVVNQLQRIWSDDGRNDKNFTKEELHLKAARDNLYKAINNLKVAADGLVEALLKLD